MLADAEIPVRVPGPFDFATSSLQTERGSQVIPAQQFIENEAVVDAFNAHFATIARIG